MMQLPVIGPPPLGPFPPAQHWLRLLRLRPPLGGDAGGQAMRGPKDHDQEGVLVLGPPSGGDSRGGTGRHQQQVKY